MACAFKLITSCLLILAVATTAGSVPAPADEVDQEFEKLQGTWLLWSAHSISQSFHLGEASQVKWIIDGESITGDVWIAVGAKLSLEPGKACNKFFLECSTYRRPYFLHGLYEISGKTLRLLLVDVSKEIQLPASFPTEAGQGYSILIFKRAKAK